MTAAPTPPPPPTSRTGVLVVNLGTPDAPTTPAVRRYLRQFLSDGRVIDINPVGRWALVNLIIAPFRAPRSAHAYQSVWTERGSPLLFHGQDLVARLAERLDPWPVRLAMRYGNPSIESALNELNALGCDRVVVFPLYPQYASSTTGSTLEEVYRLLSRPWNTPSVVVVPPYFDDPRFLDAFAAVARPVAEEVRPERYVFSFHGVPERHVRKSDESEGQRHCLRGAGCCEVITHANRNCYRAQCVATAHGIARSMGLRREEYLISFQSRLGRDPWLQPYTDKTIEALARDGVKRVAVLCPAFTADCLETIEEIGVEAKESFEAAGGERLALVPSLNSHAAWVEAAVGLIRDGAPARA
jgi:ferrochelatase